MKLFLKLAGWMLAVVAALAVAAGVHLKESQAWIATPSSLGLAMTNQCMKYPG